MRIKHYTRAILLGFLLLSTTFFITIFTTGASQPGVAQAAPNALFIVTYTLDAEDLIPGDSRCDASADPGDQCTLRAAIQETNALAGAQEIVVNPGIYTLTGAPDENEAATGDLDIKGDLTITGATADSTIIDGNASDRIFHISTEISVNIQNLTLRNGNPGHLQAGGAILNESGSLTLESSKVITNTATYGGGLRVFGSTGTNRISNSLISDNRAAYGGGILNTSSLALENSVVSDNRIAANNMEGGGGIHNNGALTIVGSTINNNHNPFTNGGGIYSKAPGSLTLIDSTVSNNTTLNFGAGVFINGGTLNVTGNTVSGNHADGYGGGLFILDCTSHLVNSTISGNRAKGHGGGLYIDHHSGNDQPIYLSNLTVVGNISNSDRSDGGDGGGIYIESEFTENVSVKNTILAGNLRRDILFYVEDDCFGALQSQDYNLIKKTSDCTINGQTGHNQIGVSPMLSSLGDHGGETNTHTPEFDSPVIDMGNPAGCKDGHNNTLLADQRGAPRNVDGNGDTSEHCDIGAVEYALPNIYLPLVSR